MPTILIYEATRDERCLIRKALRNASSWDIVEAASRDAAIANLDAGTIDMIVMSSRMLNSDRKLLLHQFSSHRGPVPIVWSTASAGERGPNVGGLWYGAADEFPKVAVARDLIVTIERLLNQAVQQRRGALAESSRRSESTLTLLDNDLDMIPVLVRHLFDTCPENAIFCNGGRMRAAVALQEAMVNGIVHGNLEVPSQIREVDDERFDRLIQQRRTQSPYCERTLCVMTVFTDSAAHFIVRDEGPGFDIQQVPDPTEFKNLDKPYGRGLLLIRSSMDEVSFNERGNEIRLNVSAAPHLSQVR